MKKLKIGEEKLVKTETKYGDYCLISSLQSPIWKELLTNSDKAFSRVFKNWFLFQRGMFNFCFFNIFRTNAGINQSGICVSIASCLFLASINSPDIWLFTKGLGLFYIPISMFWKTSDEMVTMLITESNSTLLLYYNGLLIITSLISIFKMYLGYTDQDDLSSRGTSRIYLFFKWVFRKLKIKKVKVNRQFIEGVLEVLILIAIGALLYKSDKYGAVFFFLMAFSEISIQVSNKAATIKKLTLMHV